MAQDSSGSFLKNVTVPRQNTDFSSRRPPFRYDNSRPPSNEKAVHTNRAFVNHNRHLSKGNHTPESHQANHSRHKYQGTAAQSLSISSVSGIANGPAVRGEDGARTNNQLPSLDYQNLLLCLAEEYFAAAHGIETLDAIFRREMEMQAYYKLIATGLGCLEAVLKVRKPLGLLCCKRRAA
jgi:hypothetical protein